MFKINTEKELYSFLKILSEESVKKSRSMLKEGDDPYIKSYLDQRSEEKNMFEQEFEEPTIEKTEDEDQKKELQSDEETEKASSEDQTAEKSQEEEKFVASKDRLVDFVNDIRSAPSIKDSAVSDQINDYYDRLSQEEKDVLVFFLRELSRVMTGKSQGSEARDPSDPPLKIKFVHEDEKEQEDQAETPDASSPPEEEKKDSGPESSDLDSLVGASDEEEDTSAPIKVNESQEHKYIREKIRKLLK